MTAPYGEGRIVRFVDATGRVVVGSIVQDGAFRFAASDPVRYADAAGKVIIGPVVVDTGFRYGEGDALTYRDALGTVVVGSGLAVSIARCLADEYPTPTAPTPLRTFYVDAVAGSDAYTVAQAQSPATPWKTTGKINANAIAGDRFYLQGTFNAANGSGRLGDVINAAGTAANPIQIRQWPAAAPAILDGGGAYPTVWLTAVMKYWWFQDVEIRSTGGFGFDGVLSIATSDNHMFIGCTFDGCGIHLIGSSDTWMYECRFSGTVGTAVSNNGDWVLWQNGSHRCRLVRCVTLPAATAWHSVATITYQGAGEATCDDCIMAQNNFHNPGAAGIILNGKALRTLVECNDIHDISIPGAGGLGSRCGIELDGDSCTVRYNRVWTVYQQGITIQSRTFAGFVQPGARNAVYNNTFWNCGGVPIEFAQRDTGNLLDNVVSNNIGWANNTLGTSNAGGWDSGIYYMVWADFFNVSVGTNVWSATNANGNVVRNNLLARVDGTSTDRWVLVVRRAIDGGNLSFTMAAAEAAYTGWAGNKEKLDPLFESLVIPDLRLKAGSPAIDMGFPIPGVLYVGTAPDAGAYERSL